MQLNQLPAALQNAPVNAELAPAGYGILPSISSIPTFNHTTTLTPVVCDDRAIMTLLESILSRGGVSASEAARRMGTTSQNVRQYLRGRRSRPSLLWFIKLCSLCGAKVSIEFPSNR